MMPANTPGAHATGARACLRLPWRAPLDFDHLLAFLGQRALAGVEQVADGAYRRAFAFAGQPGWFELRAAVEDAALALRVHHSAPAALEWVGARLRRMFDLDADPARLAAHFAADPLLGPLSRCWPGQRVPGAFDPFEMAVRAVLGQQVSVAAARTLATRITTAWGRPLAHTAGDGPACLFPDAPALAQAPLEAQGVMPARAACIRGLAHAVADGRIDFDPGQPLARFVRTLTALPGIGPWTAHYIAMRALDDRDAFPAADLILRRSAGNGRTLAARELEVMSQPWRPWRAYAVMWLWRAS